MTAEEINLILDGDFRETHLDPEDDPETRKPMETQENEN